MRKSEVDILYNIEKVSENSIVLQQLPKSPQQQFMLTYAAIYLINKGSVLPIVDKLLLQRTGSASQILLKLKYMKQCMQNRVNLDNKDFHVLNTLVLWVQQLKKAQKNQAIKLVDSILLPQPHELSFEYYQQFIVYLNYLAVDIQNLFKAKSNKWQPDDLILFLQMALPRIHYNIILPADLFQSTTKEQSRDQLFSNLTLQYFTNTRLNYRGLCKLVLSSLISLELKTTQMRSLIDIVCRYYLLFWSDTRQEAAGLFISAFSKATEAVRFSFTDELLLFFKICHKLGAVELQEQLRRKWEWIDSLLVKYKDVVVGHPKEDVSPFNPLSIREKFSVEAGKSLERVVEIYKDETLFYFMVQVGENDINLKLYYLGDFDSKTQVKKLLHFDEKKSGENRFAYMASKRGLYMIEFDNSYSWINSKTISFEQVTLVKGKHQQYPPWLIQMYEVNSPVVIRQPKTAKATVHQVANNQGQQTIQTHNLQEIYSSQQYEQELVEEEQIEIERQEFKENKQLVPSQEKLPTFEEDALDSQPQQTHSKQHRHQPQAQQLEHSPVNQQKQSTPGSLNQKQHSIPNLPENQQSTKPNPIFVQISNPVLSKEEAVNQSPQNMQQVRERSEQHQEAPIKEEQANANKGDNRMQIGSQAKNEIKSLYFLGQANLSLIDSIFSLLVSTQGHTYEFQTNLQDRIIKRLKSYCQGQQQYQWIVNGEARDWLKKRGFGLTIKGGAYCLFLAQTSSFIKKQSSQKQ